MMKIRRGKQIASEYLKQNLDKGAHIKDAAAFSIGIVKGNMLERCQICSGADAKDLVEIYGFLYRECLGCGTAFVANPPVEEELQAAYRSNYYNTVNGKLFANDEIIEYRVRQIAEPKVAFVRENLTTKKNTWLDIGCGNGEILSVAKNQGFDVLGLEVNPVEIEYASARFGITVRDEFITRGTLDNYRGRYGVVSLFSVLEHVLAPNAILKDVAQIQSSGDNLVIEVPHYPSVSALSQMTFPEHVNRMMHPPLHLFLFPLAALKDRLAVYGYEVKAAWFFGQDFYEMFSTLGLFEQRLNGSKLHKVLAPLVNDFQQVIDDHGLSDEVLIVAEKIS